MSEPEKMHENTTSCEWYEASIAASLYERLPHEERSHLEAHLAVCAACRATEAELKQLVAEIPAGKLSEDVDLWPALQARIAPRRARFHWSLYAAAAVFALVVGANVARIALLPAPDPAQLAQAPSPMQSAIAQAQQAAAAGDFGAALKGLQGALEAAPGDPDAGKAQMALAALEFGHGQRYAEALAAYETLKARYPAEWQSNSVNADRLDLLAEAKTANFEPLYALNAARNSAGDPFPQLERLAALPDKPLLASLAVQTMFERMGGAEAAGAERLQVLEAMRDRCVDPVAAAQVKLALANAHWKDLGDTAAARAIYGELAANAEPRLAQAARDALAKLEAGR